MKYQVKVSTKDIDEKYYPAGLAGAVHFSLRDQGGQETELNRGYGILFARGEISEIGTIVPKAVRKPEIFRTPDGGFLVCALRTEENGEPEETEKKLYWRSRDLIHFEESDRTEQDEEGLLPAELSDEEAERVLHFWNADPGKAMLPFPKASGLADPVFYRRDGKWYFIFTNDNENDIGIYLRTADTIPALLSDDTPMHKILDVDPENGLIQNFWAPEIHEIGGETYIFFAVSGKEFGPCCHAMKLKAGGSLTDPQSWETPVPVRRKDGSVLTKPEYLLTETEKQQNRPMTDGHADDRFGISLDMTYLEDAGRSYLIWSYRKDIGTPRDSGSMLMIAETTKETPWQLTTDPVLLSLAVQNRHGADISAFIQSADLSRFADKAAPKGDQLGIGGEKPAFIRLLRVQILLGKAKAKEPLLPPQQQEALPSPEQKKNQKDQIPNGRHAQGERQDLPQPQVIEEPAENAPGQRYGRDRQQDRPEILPAAPKEPSFCQLLFLHHTSCARITLPIRHA